MHPTPTAPHPASPSPIPTATRRAPAPARTAREIRNAEIAGRRTSFRLEGVFWDAAREVARETGISVNQVLTHAVAAADGATMASAVRVYLLRHYCPTIGAAGGTARARVNFEIAGRRTAFYLEHAVWVALREICRRQETSLDELCERLIAAAPGISMASALRTQALATLRGDDGPPQQS